ncbi:MAG TPA: hypothetical protein VKF37_19170 [Chloroflexota bacterium]|nr:hypothetical protein [Chloroflexota bacterium]
MAAGALAGIFINPGEAIHEGICTTIWGTPDLAFMGRQPSIPVVAVNQPDGRALIAAARQGRTVALATRLDTGWRRIPVLVAVLVAEIAGTRAGRIRAAAWAPGLLARRRRRQCETLGLAVPSDAVRRVTERVGAVAETEQQAAIAQAQQGLGQPDTDGTPVLVVEVDGVQVHLDDAWHEMKVGRVAPLGPAVQTEKRSGRTFLRRGPSRCCAGLEAAEEFWYRVYVQACRGGLGRATRRVVVLGDGAEWIWKRAAQFVGGPSVEVIEIVDINHAYDHLWAVGRPSLTPRPPRRPAPSHPWRHAPLGQARCA